LWKISSQEVIHSRLQKPDNQNILYEVVVLCFRTTTVPVVPDWSQFSSGLVYWSVELFHCALLTGSH